MTRRTARLVILGTGGTSRDILDLVADLNDASPSVAYECVTFLDDNRSLWSSTLQNVPISGPLASAVGYTDCVFVNGIGSPESFRGKESLIASLGLPPERFATLVHPTASVSRTARLGRGTVLFPHVTVASNARIGHHVVVLPNSILSHDVQIGDYSCVAGGAALSGDVKVGRGCYVGSRAAVIGGVSVGDGALVGMGAVVLRRVAPGTVVVGNPARPLPARPSSVSSSSPSGPAPLSRQSPAGASR